MKEINLYLVTFRKLSLCNGKRRNNTNSHACQKIEVKGTCSYSMRSALS